MYSLLKIVLFATVTTALLFFISEKIIRAGNTESRNESYTPQRQKPLRRTEGVGSRGCSELMTESVELISPSDRLANTASAHPTFLWYVSGATAKPIRFSLVDPDAAKTIFLKWIKVDKPGIVQLDIPSDIQGLIVGKQYTWTVTVICNDKRPSENIYVQAVIQRVPINDNLARRLAVETDVLVRAKIYAQAGIWYDAVSSAYKTHELTQNEDKDYFQQLLAEAGLLDIAIKEDLLSTRQYRRQNRNAWNLNSKTFTGKGKE